MKFDGRILFLGTEPGAVAAQLQGQDLSLAEAGPLRSDISTDEITPLPILLNYDARLARYAHTGTMIGDEKPIGENAIADGGFAVIVAGKRYGKGSSREHSPLAEKSAGIRLVIAESFERIYRQNCDNLGIFTSTDFGLIERIRADEDIALEELVAGRDTLAQAILRAGGLLAYGQDKLKGAKLRGVMPDGPLTLAQKIVARHALDVDGIDWDLSPGTGGFVRAGHRFIHEYYTAMAAHMLHDRFGKPLALFDPKTVVLFEDHLSYAHRSPTHLKLGLLPQVRELSEAHRAFGKDYGLTDHGYLLGEDGSEGISHAMMAESYALPGGIVVGTDSHTPHSGAVGCFAYGVGTTDMANAFVTGAIRLTMAESLRVRLEGVLRPDVMAKDVVLKLLSTDLIRSGGGLGRIFEFTGPVVDAMSIDERATLTNMVAELGGLTGLCAPDAETVRFLKERRGLDFALEDWMHSDEGATYAEEVTLDCSEIGPMLARPGDPGNGVPVDELDEPIKVDIAYGGSCTAGKREDFDRYYEVARWAADRGLKVAPGIELYLQCGTVQVRDYCLQQGYLQAFEAIGAEMLGPSCGACGQCGPGVSSRDDQVTISAINRNFPGRGGPGKTWLASPPTVVASAIAGRIMTFEALIASLP
ncbi:3-isopropylmalate dehydratase [Salipiger pacificus]|uniref:3-isopropylmalate dehydratase n=2 Tax=Salipiger mangrovisoli TaxID=2865933 RepID=A0ABR9XB85_9RHOB|nr:3-isopropylmalate dehydratase [Salipiger mangrovisoli]